MDFFGITWLGLNAQTGRKLLASIVLLALVLAASSLLRAAVGLVLTRTDHATVQTRFWTRQAVSLVAALVLLLGLASIWFDEPSRLATAFGLMSAGLAFALQQVITSIAGYFVILRGETFRVGDRISMGGVRGDVMRLGFIQTTIMEMGQPLSSPSREHATWVKSRQFTGRIVSVSNAKIFTEPVFNYTRDFPYIWEEMSIPIDFAADREAVERILLDAAAGQAVRADELVQNERDALETSYGIGPIDLQPHVYWRITDNWLELTVRFLARPHGTRDLKDRMSRQVLAAMDAAGIRVASARVEVAGGPPWPVGPAVRDVAKDAS